jgi:hypothetical protein
MKNVKTDCFQDNNDFSTSVVISFLTETFVWLDLDLTEDLLEFFFIPTEASLLLVAWDSVSGEISGTCAAGTDLSEVLLDLDLMEDLLELFGMLVEASLPFAARVSVLPCSKAFRKK